MNECRNSRSNVVISKKEEHTADTDLPEQQQNTNQHKASKSMNPKLCDIILQNLNHKYNIIGRKHKSEIPLQKKNDPEESPYEKLSTYNGKVSLI